MTFKELLKQQGFTQERLAKHLHITQKSISEWVRNKSIPLNDQILKIANILNVESTDVLQCFISKNVNI